MCTGSQCSVGGPGLRRITIARLRRRDARCVLCCTRDMPRSGPLAQTCAGERKAKSALGHVWTAPSWQELSSRCRVGRCSHVFGLYVRFT